MVNVRHSFNDDEHTYSIIIPWTVAAALEPVLFNLVQQLASYQYFVLFFAYVLNAERTLLIP